MTQVGDDPASAARSRPLAGPGRALARPSGPDPRSPRRGVAAVAHGDASSPLFALGLAKYEVKHFHITNAKAVLESHDGLLGSDAGWYQTIAAHGYGALPRSATRFFPLLPLLDRGLHDVTP